MATRKGRPAVALSAPVDGGTAFGVAAPAGSVTQKDVNRARNTSMERRGATVVMHTQLGGRVRLQRLRADGGWDTVREMPVWRFWHRTRVNLASPQLGPDEALRVLFLPRNPGLQAWVSESFGVEGP